MARRGVAAPRLVAIGLAASLGCAGLLASAPPPPDPRMLRATIGPGADRLMREAMLDDAVFERVLALGRPDYVWAPTEETLVLLYLAADRAVPFAGPAGARVALEPKAPIPDAWLDLAAAEDREEVRARRLDLVGRAHVRPPGWCDEDSGGPPPARACLGEPAVRERLAEIRRRTLVAWQAPAPEHGGERVVLRFRLAASGELEEGCALGATSPAAAASALSALGAALPVAPLDGAAACLAGVSLVWRFELATE